MTRISDYVRTLKKDEQAAVARNRNQQPTVPHTYGANQLRGWKRTDKKQAGRAVGPARRFR